MPIMDASSDSSNNSVDVEEATDVKVQVQQVQQQMQQLQQIHQMQQIQAHMAQAQAQAQAHAAQMQLEPIELSARRAAFSVDHILERNSNFPAMALPGLHGIPNLPNINMATLGMTGPPSAIATVQTKTEPEESTRGDSVTPNRKPLKFSINAILERDDYPRTDRSPSPLEVGTPLQPLCHFPGPGESDYKNLTHPYEVNTLLHLWILHKCKQNLLHVSGCCIDTYVRKDRIRIDKRFVSKKSGHIS